jgi:hypothetical protein
MTAITHIVLADKDGAGFVGLAKSRAAQLYAQLERSKRKFGSQRFEVSEGDKTFYIEISVAAPHVRILIDSKGCPAPVNGLVWIKSFFEPTVTVDEIKYLRTMFKKDAPLVQEDVAKLAPISAQLLTIRSTMFSGEMRKVVQLLQGMGQSVPYSCTASTTHGVFRLPSHAPWVIRISRKGVVAYPMNTCRGKNSPTDLGYTPLPTAEPEEPRVLMTEEQIKDAYDNKGAFYGTCGWAFSANGSKAANCFVGSEDIYSYSWQYQISITADAETGEPVSAMMALLKEGYIHGPRATHMKYPRGDVPIALYSFDPFRGNANYRNNCEAPVFCYFDGEALQTYFYVYSPSDSFTRTEAGDRPGLCYELEGVPVYDGTYSETARPTIQLNRSHSYRDINDSRDTQQYTTSYLGIGVEPNESLNGSFVLSALRLTFVRESGRSETTTRTDVLIVTGYDREAAYLCTSTAQNTGGHRYWVVNHTVQKDAFNYQNVENCEATGSSATNAIVVTDYRSSVFSDELCQSGLRYGLKGMDVWTGTGAGSTIRLAEQVGFVPGWDGCLSVRDRDTVFAPANFSDVPAVDINTPRKTIVNYTLRLDGSGNFRVAVKASDAEMADWMAFIQRGLNDQSAQIVRDAFKPQRAAYSNAVMRTNGRDMVESQFAPYDPSLISGSMFFFVGEP